jgi:hypothetical protein
LLCELLCALGLASLAHVAELGRELRRNRIDGARLRRDALPSDVGRFDALPQKFAQAFGVHRVGAPVEFAVEPVATIRVRDHYLEACAVRDEMHTQFAARARLPPRIIGIDRIREPRPATQAFGETHAERLQ